jgi:two-component system nitrogen regulation sensor histidine kinase NtrY
MLTVNFGMESWFSSQVRSVVGNALETAEAYETEHRGNVVGDALAMANDLNRAGMRGIDQAQLGELVRQQGLLRELAQAYILNSNAEIIARGEFSYLFTLDPPSPEAFATARSGEVVVIDDGQNNELRALVHLTGFIDSYLYITRRVRGEVLQLLDETRETVALYERLEAERGRVLFDFALVYLGFALVVILAAVWTGLRIAERLAKPIGGLAAAATGVGAGDLDMQVKEPKGDDEIAVLARAFNHMTAKLKEQRADLVHANQESEGRRRLIEAVLSGVNAGIVGLDAQGRIDLMNSAAGEMLGVAQHDAEGALLDDVVPPLAALRQRAGRSIGGAAQDQVHLSVRGRGRDLLARITPKADDGSGGAVLTLDDLTELVAAQRMAAWGDVARRVAHEIKNPLTPIQLSADRLRRKFGKLPEEDRRALEQYADVIVRQAGDIRRMVDAFSKFARMPEPHVQGEDIAAILRGAVFLQQSGSEDIVYTLDAPDEAQQIACDRGLINQALTNLLKNAAEAIHARLAAEPDGPAGEIRARLTCDSESVVIEISDNGTGLPEADRERLMEPYVTTRAKGTGLGLAIVRKVIEQHGGTITFEDAADAVPTGARVRLTLPRLRAATPELPADTTATMPPRTPVAQPAE